MEGDKRVEEGKDENSAFSFLLFPSFFFFLFLLLHRARFEGARKGLT